MNQLLQQIKNIDGFLTDKEGELLFELAKKNKKGVIVEIGSWKGKSTVCLALGSKDGAQHKVFAIDPHTGSSEHQEEFQGKVWTFDIFSKNIENAGVKNIVEPIVKMSGDAVKEFEKEIGLLFIDGAHEYDAVLKDFTDWDSKVLIGGIIAFHDTVGWAGPRKVVEEHLFKSKNFKNVRFVDSITYGTKVEKNTFFERIKNRYELCLRNVSESIRALRIPKPIKKVGKKLLEVVT